VVTSEVVSEIINESSFQARHICGSEGLYQCIIYDVTKRHPEVDSIEREVPVTLPDGNTGYLDFVIESKGVSIAIELKAGANSHRNSLDKAKEVDKCFGAKKSGGLLKDFEKLSAFIKNGSARSRRAVSICLETAYIKKGFTPNDVDKYSSLANEKSIDFVYGTPGSSPTNLWICNGKRNEVVLNKTVECNLENKNVFDISKLNWAAYFSDISMSEPKDETFAQGILYHHLRSTSLSEKQCASEVFFHFALKAGTRASYWLPDLAVFNAGFSGRFNLGVNSHEKVQNDYEKLCSLNTIIEIKGSKQFEKFSTNKKIDLIRQDIEKLNSHLRPSIETKIRKEGIKRERKVDFAMVVASPDIQLKEYLKEASKEYGQTIQIFWSGAYS
jgi:hypothetical protein